MKILLINPPVRQWAPPNCFPQGLGMIAQVLRKDHDIQILDLNVIRASRGILKNVLSGLIDSDIDAIGITGLITNYKYVKDIILHLKTLFPRIPIIVGGVLGSSIPEIMLRKAGADICVIGEGEETAVELFRVLDSGVWASIDGIAYLSGTGDYIQTPPRKPIKNINQLPLPAYDLFNTETYAKNPVGSAINVAKWDNGEPVSVVQKSMNILSSRGCAWNCLFCYHDYMGVKYRYRRADSLIAEMYYLRTQYDVEFILMGDDCFVTNKRNVLDFCAVVEGLDFQWEAGGRVDTVDKELLQQMKDAGCVMVGYGIESGSQQILDTLNKKTTVKKCHQAIEMTQDIFGSVDCTFIIGSPGETKETIQETIDFCKTHNLPPQAIFFLTPYPGTPLWRWMREKGYFGSERMWLDEEEHLCLKLSDNEQGEKIVINFTDFSDKELYEIKEKMVDELNAWNKQIH